MNTPTVTSTYSLDINSLTVIRTTSEGESFDLTGDGEPCQDVGQLRAFVSELRRAGAYGRDVEAALLADLG